MSLKICSWSQKKTYRTNRRLSIAGRNVSLGESQEPCSEKYRPEGSDFVGERGFLVLSYEAIKEVRLSVVSPRFHYVVPAEFIEMGIAWDRGVEGQYMCPFILILFSVTLIFLAGSHHCTIILYSNK